jgi:hypothetical protein
VTDTSAAAPRFHRKSLAALLAFLGGGLGLHRLYLGLRGWWLAPALVAASLPWLIGTHPWYQAPAFFAAMFPVVVGFVEAVVLALTTDPKFDARYNAGVERSNRSGWDAVLVALATMVVGTIIALTAIVLLVQTIVEKMQAGTG